MDRKKYVFEASDDVKKVMAMGVTRGGAIWTDTMDVENFEELNSDYINEHYGSLQDEAYQKGYDKGYADKTNNDEVGKELAKDIYQRGLENGKAQDNHGCEGCEWDGASFDVCSKCRNSYGNLYKRKEPRDKIKVGDEVVWTEDEDVVIIVTLIYTSNDMEWCDGICRDGKVYQILTEHARKTGRHFDIDKILKAMKE